MINRLVGVSDFVLFLIAAALLADPPVPVLASGLLLSQIVVIALAEVLVYIAVLERIGGYRVERYADPVAAFFFLIAGLAPALVLSLVLLWTFLPSALWQAQWLLAWHVLLLGILMLGRLLQRWLIGLATRWSLLRRRVVVVGTGPTAEAVVRSLGEDPVGYDIRAIYRLDNEPRAESVAGIPVMGNLDALGGYATAHTIDVVVLALPLPRLSEAIRLVESVSWIAADVVIPFERPETSPSFAAIMPLGRLRSLQVLSRPFKGTQGLLKVMEDYVVASIGLLVLSPLMLVAALAIRLEGPGPVLFRQMRPGFGRRPFFIYKFRTMKVNPDDDATVGTTGPADPRVTRVGSVLRRLSIDELPQLLNVLKGEMSIVGPRPYVANMLVENERFSDLVNQYAERHRIKPGLTGYAQAHGMRSYALRSPENARRSIEMDLHYMTHWSLWLDVKIMVRTLLVGLAGRNVF
ncbi:exopolysaccharide biosynthesis polyprenyl glycosylphosphotransferase [Pararoseomonas indoligenes]|uniref:Exopolysaccharide biosynthesis polyprenyl glycosylphosphotransferase n=1 Tax=Roseomonas indoligenes TaxID=2820811 RepID=A0A940MXH3_9PROT|nr:exopolysaccharide biosynthesis polyprenyl glycosylphosphotransferase [Pararoseomonas indoligenes]MBP0492624.1 exopolysaccharide biosynthesis polyprenyl glycosylphosphotransferase [Pararoseomonas indoligenes]